jgi:hypothetical protein
MKYDARLEVKLSAERRQRLDDLATGPVFHRPPWRGSRSGNCWSSAT